MKKMIALSMLSMILAGCCSFCKFGGGPAPAGPKFVEKGELRFIGMNTYTDFLRGNFDAFPATWERFIPHIGEINGRVNTNEFYGLNFYPADWTPKKKWNYMAAVEVKSIESIPLTMLGKTVPANKYAVFTHKGPARNLGNSYYYIYADWLPKSKYEMAADYNFELCDERFKTGEEADSEVDIYIPVKEK